MIPSMIAVVAIMTQQGWDDSKAAHIQPDFHRSSGVATAYVGDKTVGFHLMLQRVHQEEELGGARDCAALILHSGHFHKSSSFAVVGFK